METGLRESEQAGAATTEGKAAASGDGMAGSLTSPAGVMALQRRIGNRAVVRMLQRDPQPAADPLIPVVGERLQKEYEFKIEPAATKTDRTSFSLRFAVIRDVKALKAKGEDMSATVAPFKETLTLGGGKLTRALAMAAAKADWTLWEPWPGVKFQGDLKALEAKLEDSKLDVNALVVALQGSGTIDRKTPDVGLGALARSLFKPALDAGLAVKFTGRFEVKVDPHDAVKLARIAKNARLQTETTVKAAKLRKSVDGLKNQVLKDQQLLKTRGSKLSKAKRKLIKDRIAKNQAKITRMTTKLKSLGGDLKRLAESTTKLKGALKSKAGRLVGALVTKVAGKLLLKLIPVVNVVLLVVDIAEVSWKIYQLATGKAKFGWEGDDTGGTADESGDTGDAGAQDSADTGTAEGGDSGAHEPADSGDSGAADWQSAADEQLFTPAEQELMSDIEESVEPPELHEGAQAVVEALKDEQGQGVPFTPEDLEQLNALVPEDMSDEQLTALVERLQAGGAETRAEASLEALGDINAALRDVQEPPMSMIVEDEAGVTTFTEEELDAGAGDTGTGEAAKPPAEPAAPGGGGPGKDGGSGGLPTVEPLTGDEAAADPQVQRSFVIISGLESSAQKSPRVFPLTVDIDIDGKLQRVTMDARVVAREVAADAIRITVENVTGWKAVQGDRVIATMRPGATVVFTFKP